mgnify:FL=1
MHEKYKEKGVILVALSYEPDGVVAPYVAKHKIPYIVGSGAKSSRDAYGIRGYPTAFLIDPEGKIAWKGHPMVAEAAIEDLIKKSDPEVRRKLLDQAAARALGKADRLREQARHAEALAAYDRVVADFKDHAAAKTAQEAAAKIRNDPVIMEAIRKAEIDEQAQRWLTMARVLAKHGAVQDAARYYGTLLKNYPDSRHAEAARQELAQLPRG